MRTYTREQVEQVVRETAQRYERSADAHMRAGEKRGEAFERGRVEGCHEVLRRLDALPNPPATPESSTDIDNLSGESPAVQLVRLAAEAGLPVRFVQRPRAPTPTPEVPAYAKQDGTRRAALTRLHEGLDPLPTGVLASNEPTPEAQALKDETCPCPDAPARHKFSCNLAQPEPTAPEVVWTGDGVRVLADGTCEEEWPTPRGWAVVTDDRAMVSLARALAEAKLDARLARASLAAEREALRQTDVALAEAKREAAQHRVAVVAVRHAALNQSWAAAGGDVIAIHAALLASDTADAVREAAESMRERAKALIMAEQAKQEDGPLSDDNGHAFRLLLRLADDVGALPLEKP